MYSPLLVCLGRTFSLARVCTESHHFTVIRQQELEGKKQANKGAAAPAAAAAGPASDLWSDNEGLKLKEALVTWPSKDLKGRMISMCDEGDSDLAGLGVDDGSENPLRSFVVTKILTALAAHVRDTDHETISTAVAAMDALPTPEHVVCALGALLVHIERVVKFRGADSLNMLYFLTRKWNKVARSIPEELINGPKSIGWQLFQEVSCCLTVLFDCVVSFFALVVRVRH